MSDPIPVSGGYRIVKLLAKTSGSVVPFETAKNQLRDRLMMSRYEKEYEAYMQDIRKNATVELRVREVPLQLTGSLTEGSLLEGLDATGPLPGSSPAASGSPPAPPKTPGAADTIVIPTEKKPITPPAADEEITTTPQAAPEKIAPPPPPAAPKPQEPPPPR